MSATSPWHKGSAIEWSTSDLGSAGKRESNHDSARGDEATGREVPEGGIINCFNDGLFDESNGCLTQFRLRQASVDE